MVLYVLCICRISKRRLGDVYKTGMDTIGREPVHHAMFTAAPLTVLLSLALTSGLASAAQTMRIASYNLRYDSQPDNITVQQSLDSLPDPLQAPTYYGKKGEQPWSTRRVKVYQNLNNEGIVLAGQSRMVTAILR